MCMHESLKASEPWTFYIFAFLVMEGIIVRAVNGDKIGPVFVENQEIYLADIR